MVCFCSVSGIGSSFSKSGFKIYRRRVANTFYKTRKRKKKSSHSQIHIYNNTMSYTDIISDLKSRGERNISFKENGIIVSWHGLHTINYWYVKDGELICFDCKTVY